MQGYNQEEGIDYDETFALVAEMEAIWILIAFVAYMKFKLFQMDVKSAFRNGYLKEEVNVKHHPSFEDIDKPNHVIQLDKAMIDWSKLQGLDIKDFLNFSLQMVAREGRLTILSA